MSILEVLSLVLIGFAFMLMLVTTTNVTLRNREPKRECVRCGNMLEGPLYQCNHYLGSGHNTISNLLEEAEKEWCYL